MFLAVPQPAVGCTCVRVSLTRCAAAVSQVVYFLMPSRKKKMLVERASYGLRPRGWGTGIFFCLGWRRRLPLSCLKAGGSTPFCLFPNINIYIACTRCGWYLKLCCVSVYVCVCVCLSCLSCVVVCLSLFVLFCAVYYCCLVLSELISAVVFWSRIVPLFPVKCFNLLLRCCCTSRDTSVVVCLYRVPYCLI